MRGGPSALSWRYALALVALALAVRLPGLGRSLWYDELFTLANFAGSPGAALATQRGANNHPPASLLAWAVGQATGPAASSEVALRLPFALAGALAAGALALAVGRAFGARAGWAAGALVAVAPLHVLASQQVRGYALMTLGAALALGGLLAILRERGASRRSAALLVVGLALGVWAHLTLAASALGWSAALALAWGLAREAPARRAARQALLATLGGLAAGLLLGAPVLGRTWKFARANLTVAPASGVHPGPLAPSDLAATLGAEPSALALALALLAALGAAALARRAPQARLAGALLVAPPLAAAALVAGGALGYPRFLLFALPPALALAGLGLAALARRRAALATVALATCVLLAAPGAGGGEELQDVRGAARQAAGWSARLGGAPVIGVGPGGELLAAYLAAARADPTGAVAAEHTGPAVFVIPLPAWLDTAPAEVRAALAQGEPRLLLPGRESDVLLVVRTGR